MASTSYVDWDNKLSGVDIKDRINELMDAKGMPKPFTIASGYGVLSLIDEIRKNKMTSFTMDDVFKALKIRKGSLASYGVGFYLGALLYSAVQAVSPSYVTKTVGPELIGLCCALNMSTNDASEILSWANEHGWF